MVQELIGKTVDVYINSFSDFGEKIKGKILRVNGSWVEIKTKKKVEYLNITSIKRIIVSS